MDTVNSKGREMLNKVPEVTLYFWIIKILCTTVGETAADFLNVNLNFGLTTTSIITGVLLAISLFFQFRAKKYIPSVYWFTVGLVSVFGTLVTDNLTDKLGVPLEVSTIIFAILLGLTFLIWYINEKTLSIHSIFTTKREIFYWSAILFTFALGTASGDLFAEGLGLGYLVTGLIVAGIIALTSVAWKMRLNSVLSFWIIYIMTRPLGASIGDLLSQPTSHGGLGLGATLTSAIFVGGILLIVTYLSLTRRDVILGGEKEHQEGSNEKGGLWQTAVVLALFIVLGGSGYYIRHRALQAEIPSPQNSSDNATTTLSLLGDLTVFRTITQDTLNKLNAGDQSGATTRIGDLEYAWDKAQPVLKSRNSIEWSKIDAKIDTVLRELRSTNPNPTTEKSALTSLLSALQ
ncbi:hypothetical protein H0W91_01265 [Patescibacteria group bacterium]|nr:hypothetical protein [Patescibacteria group bacterium]